MDDRESFLQKTGLEKAERPAEEPQARSQSRFRSKKDHIIALYRSGVKDLRQIVHYTQARPSYVAQVLQRENLISGYSDLYTPTSEIANIYARAFRNVLSFKTPAAARNSVRKIDQLYSYYERAGDRAGQHQAMVLALIGKNRARWSGKATESQIFHDWLVSH